MKDGTPIEYMIWQAEKGEGTGTIHIQGYFKLRKKKRFAQVVDLLEGGESLELEEEDSSRS